jgi:hypothetical protein
MGRFRLNGWQRLGIVLSVVWAIVGGLYTRHADVKSASDMYILTYRSCMDAGEGQPGFDGSDCTKRAERMWDIWLKGGWLNAAFVALAPIPFFWLIAYAIVGLVRWIRRGFSPS